MRGGCIGSILNNATIRDVYLGGDDVIYRLLRGAGGLTSNGVIVISRFEEHDANERTYLAWVRTALAIAAFGFVVDKFSFWARTSAQIKRDGSSFIFDHAGVGLLLISNDSRYRRLV